MVQKFVMSEELLQGKVGLISWPLSEVLLVNDQNYPAWLVLVPRINGLIEITEVSGHNQQQLWREISELSKIVKEQCSPCKLNIASLGNIVSQLHIHITARRSDDPAWPGPCYGAVPARPWDEAGFQGLKATFFEKLQRALPSLT